MNKIHEWINTGLIVIVAILVLVGANQSGQKKLAQGTTNYGSLNVTESAGYQINGTTVVGLGSISGTGVTSNGNVSQVFSAPTAFNTASTTACSFVGSLTSTSSIDYSAARVSSSTSATTVFYFSKASTSAASSTTGTLNTFSIAANAYGSMVGTTTSLISGGGLTQVDGNNILSPGQIFNVVIAGNNAGGISGPGGVCYFHATVL